MEKEKHLFMTTYSKANGETLRSAEKCYNLCSAMIVASGRLALDLKKFDYEKVEVYEESKFKLLKQAPVMLSLPSDGETEKWFEKNIGIVNDCSASSAIYKFRLWLKERGEGNGA